MTQCHAVEIQADLPVSLYHWEIRFYMGHDMHAGHRPTLGRGQGYVLQKAYGMHIILAYFVSNSHSVYSLCSSSWDVGENSVHPRDFGPRGAVHGHWSREGKARASIDTLAACPIGEEEYREQQSHGELSYRLHLSSLRELMLICCGAARATVAWGWGLFA